MSFAVIIPTYNRAEYIGETLASITAQTLKPDEIIVVDDGSTDDTEALVRRDFSQVIYYRSDNRGAPNARHLGVSLSTATHLAFCDSDDLWQPEHLAQIAAVFAADPAIGFVFTNFREMADRLGQRDIAVATKLDQRPPDFWQVQTSELFPHALRCAAPLTAAILRFQPIFPSAMAITRALYDHIGGFKPELGMLPSEDLEFTLRAVSHAPIGVVTTPSVLIRKHSGNHSRRVAEMLIGEIIVLDVALQSHNPTPDLAQAMAEEMARRAEAAMDALYATRHTEPLPAMARAVGWHNLPRKTQIKAAIAMLPAPLARRIAGLHETPLSADLRARLGVALDNMRDRRLTSRPRLAN